MQKIATPLNDLCIIEPQVFGDDRGYFFESYNADKFAGLGIDIAFLQDNHSFSKVGALRGLHFQLPPKSMAKLVRCTRGKVWDVAVDLRKASPTYKQWFGLELSADNKKMLFIPVGFAHGFLALEDSDVIYKSSNTFDKAVDANVRFNDPEFNIAWPLTGEPLLSDRDKAAPYLNDLDLPF